MKRLVAVLGQSALLFALMVGLFHAMGSQPAEAGWRHRFWFPGKRVVRYFRNRCYFNCGRRYYSFHRPAYRSYYRPYYRNYLPYSGSFYYPLNHYGNYYHFPIYSGFNFNDYASLFHPEPRDFYYQYDHGYYGQTYVNPGYDLGARAGAIRDVFDAQVGDKYYLKNKFDHLEYEWHDGKLWWYEVMSNGTRNRIQFDAETGRAWGFQDEGALQALYDWYWNKYTTWRSKPWTDKPAPWAQNFLTYYWQDYASYEPDWRDGYAHGSGGEFYSTTHTGCANGRCSGL